VVMLGKARQKESCFEEIRGDYAGSTGGEIPGFQ